jgi:catechol 2,3-dioxygenase-like lactoylglutathione lyase family enzyme
MYDCLMLKNVTIYPTLPTTDITRSKNFYEHVLGLAVKKETQDELILKVGDHGKLYIYKRPPSEAEHTLASFEVEDLEETVDELSGKGLVFEQYDMPGIKTNEKGIAEMDDMKGAWFKDPDGNILAIGQA